MAALSRAVVWPFGVPPFASRVGIEKAHRVIARWARNSGIALRAKLQIRHARSVNSSPAPTSGSPCSGPPTASRGFGQAFDYDLAMGGRPSRYDLSAGR